MITYEYKFKTSAAVETTRGETTPVAEIIRNIAMNNGAFFTSKCVGGIQILSISCLSEKSSLGVFISTREIKGVSMKAIKN